MTGIISDNVGRPSGLIKAASGGGGGVWTLIKTLTSDGSDATMSFVNGSDDVVLESTYPIYRFTFINIHEETESSNHFTYQASTDTGSSYGVTATTTQFFAGHLEGDNDYLLAYNSSGDQAQSTDFINMNGYDTLGNDNDQSQSGEVWLFDPSSTVFIKHFFNMSNWNTNASGSAVSYGGGYFNTTSAIDAIQFKMKTDDIQDGKIKMYGLKDSA